jgi:hypothetical protein
MAKPALLMNHPAVAAAAATIIFSFAFHRYQINNVVSDFSEHIGYAQNIRKMENITAPHFLFQVLLNATHDVFGFSYEASTVVVLGLCYGAMAILIVHEIGRRAPEIGPIFRFAATLGVLVASHVFLQSIFTPNFYYGYIVPISYHNPTQQLSKMLAVAILFVYGRWVLDKIATGILTPVLLLGAGCILSAIAKPTFLIAFLPAAGLVALGHLRSGWRRATIFIVGIAIPSMAVLGLQFYWTYVAGRGATGRGIIFAPFAAANLEAFTLLIRLPGSLLFPGIVLILTLRFRSLTPRLYFAWVLLLIGLAVSFLLAEAGPRMKDGNLFWTGQTVMFLLYVESMLWLIAQTPRRVWIGWAAFSLHVICGVVFYGAVSLFAAHRYL